jgi:glutathione S-transferase
VPVLEDEQGPMFESTALVFHVAELYPEAGLLPPPGTHQRAVVQGWSIFAMTELEAPAIESARQREANPEASAKAAARCADAVAVLEGRLSGTPPYLVGSQFTVADILAGGVLGVAVVSARSNHRPPPARTWSRSRRGPRGSGRHRSWAPAGLSELDRSDTWCPHADGYQADDRYHRTGGIRWAIASATSRSSRSGLDRRRGGRSESVASGGEPCFRDK